MQCASGVVLGDGPGLVPPGSLRVERSLPGLPVSALQRWGRAGGRVPRRQPIGESAVASFASRAVVTDAP